MLWLGDDLFDEGDLVKGAAMFHLATITQSIISSLLLELEDQEWFSLPYLKMKEGGKYVCFFTYVKAGNKALVQREIYFGLSQGRVSYSASPLSLTLTSENSLEDTRAFYELFDSILSEFESVDCPSFRAERLASLLQENKAFLAQVYQPLENGYFHFSDFPAAFLTRR